MYTLTDPGRENERFWSQFSNFIKNGGHFRACERHISTLSESFRILFAVGAYFPAWPRNTNVSIVAFVFIVMSKGMTTNSIFFIICEHAICISRTTIQNKPQLTKISLSARCK